MEEDLVYRLGDQQLVRSLMVSSRIQRIRMVGMLSLKAGYVKVLHGFLEMRIECDRGCKNISRQVYGNIETRAGETLSRLIGVRDCLEHKFQMSIYQFHVFRMQVWYSHQGLLGTDLVGTGYPHLGQ